MMQKGSDPFNFVEEGDTLSGMMNDFYNGNSAGMVDWAAERNNLDNPDLIHPGQKINLAGSGVPVEVPERRSAGYKAVLPGEMKNGAYIGRMQTGFMNQHNAMMRAPCASSGCLLNNGNFNINDSYNSGIAEAMHKEDMIFAGAIMTGTGMLGGGWSTVATIGGYGLGIGEAYHHSSSSPMVGPLSGTAVEHTLRNAGYKPAIAGRVAGPLGFLIGLSVD